MTENNWTCDGCGRQTSGGPCISIELWKTIAWPYTVIVPCDPEQPFLFPIYRRFDPFLCLACMERRLGRRLAKDDLTTCAWNDWIDQHGHTHDQQGR